MLLKEPIQIALAIAKVGCEFLNPHHAMCPGEQIKGVIKEHILLLVLMKQVRQGRLKKRDRHLGIFRIPDPLLESRSPMSRIALRSSPSDR